MERPLFLLAVVALTLAVGCPGNKPAQNVGTPSARPGASSPVAWRMSKSGLGFRLSDADEEHEAAPLAKAVPLSADDTERVLARLPAMKADPDDEKDFAVREKTLPVPRAGKTVNEPFPPPASPPPQAQTKAGPLEIVRHAPVGAVEIAPHLTATFSHPMVEVTSHGDLAKGAPPISITPMPPGKWRWVGTQTVLYEPEKRFPMATDYQAEIPAGTRAASGQTLANAEKWSFSTPPPKLTQTYPNAYGVTVREPVMFVELDQAIEPAAVLKSIRLTTQKGGPAIPLRLATEADLEKDPVVRRLLEKAEPKRSLAFRAVDTLPGATAFVVHVGPGTPSAEGPKTTDKEQPFAFSTFGPLRITQHRCGWETRCPPLTQWTVQLTNPLDAEAFDKAMVKVEPPLPGIKVSAQYNTIAIQGRSRGKTTYKVTVAGGLLDTFGQTLGSDQSVTFDVGPAEPTLFPEEQGMTVIDPAGGPSVPVFSVNHAALNVRLYAVRPEDWAKYAKYREAYDDDKGSKDPPGRLVSSRTVKPKTSADEIVETPIDLSLALKDGFGQVVVVVEPVVKRKDRYSREWFRSWVQVTRIGLDAFTDAESVVAWASALETGAALEGVEISLGAGAGTGRTGVDGLARIALGQTVGDLMTARKGADLAILPESQRASSEYRRNIQRDRARFFVFDDRKLYKPGEEVKVKGLVRRLGMGKGGDVALPPASVKELSYKVHDPRGTEIGKGRAAIDTAGGFDLSFKLPGAANLGHAGLTLSLENAPDLDTKEYMHAFDIQEFRRPEFEVGARVSEGPHIVGGHAVATVAATYYAGGGLPNANVTWRVTRSTAHFVPPNRSEYTFGENVDFWWPSHRGRHASVTGDTWTGHTGASGEHRMRIDFDALEPAYPMSLDLEGTVTDVNRQAWTAKSSVLVHPADVYVGLRSERAFVRAGETMQIDAIAADIDGKAVPGIEMTVKSGRIEWEQKKGEYVEKEYDAQTCVMKSAAEAQRCTLATKDPGKYRLIATVTDAHGRKNQTETHLWVIGGDSPRDRSLPQDQVQIVADKKEYRAGQAAELLLVAPFAPAEALLTVRRQGLVLVERFTMKSTTQTVKVAIDESMVPNIVARVDIVGAVGRENDNGEVDTTSPKRPAYATGSVDLKVPPLARALTVTATPRDAKVEPGGSTVIHVAVKDARGQPAGGGEVAVVVVDEAVLALTEYKTPDPLVEFYTPRAPGVRESSLRERVVLARPDVTRMKLQEKKSAERGGRYPSGAMPPPMASPTATSATVSRGRVIAISEVAIMGKEPEIAVRTNFTPLAAFVPRVAIDAAGRASVPVKLPDNLTRYRVMAIAAAGENRFGSGESTVTARLPLMVRPSLPRFLNFGDKFEMPIVLQNQTDRAMDVDVAVRAKNATTDTGGRRVTVPANDRVEVRIAAAAARPGTAHFQIGAVSGKWSDASQIDLPVWTPATTEAFATYGTIDEGAVAQPVRMPTAIIPTVGGIEITTSSTALQALTDAVIYLVRYPYECNEQISSRMLGLAALKDVLTAFDAKGLPKPEVMLESVKRDVEKLRSRQNYTGGWDYWQSERTSPYVTIHVTHALQRVKEKGFEVNAEVLANALTYLRAIETHIPSYYGPEARRAVVAYALYVRKRMGDLDRARARRLVEEGGGAEKVGLETLGWILPVLSGDAASATEVSAIRKHLANRVSETAGAAHFVSSYGEDDDHLLLRSDRRADGVLLEALIGDQPTSDLIPKLVTGLLAHRKAGHWENTQENAFVLLGLDRYFAAYEKATPDFVARAWLGAQFAGEHTFKGRTTERSRIDIPMRYLADAKPGASVVVGKDGPGRLYYRIGMQYAPADLRPPPMDQGFTVSRVYDGVDAPSDVQRDPDGTWRVKAGAKVRVRITMVAPSRRYQVALVDQLPAGLEPMNAALAVTGSVPEDPKAAKSLGYGWWWSRSWYEHQNMRDERVEAFTSLLWEGVYDYTYVARATTPGTFVVPPPKAEEMYSPETFGRGAGDRLIVE